MRGWGTQLASDLQRDGLGVELLDARGNVVAEVFRCDADNTIGLNCFSDGIPLDVAEWFLRIARERLAEFEDGTPLPPML